MKETTVTNKIKAWFREKGGVSHKAPGGMMSSGFPDLVGCIDGRTWLVEVKAPGTGPRESMAVRGKYIGFVRQWLDKGATLAQALALREWQRAGAIAMVATCVEELESRFLAERRDIRNEKVIQETDADCQA